MKSKEITGSMKIEQIISTPEEFEKTLERAQEIVDSWPDWKKETRATSYPRPSLG